MPPLPAADAWPPAPGVYQGRQTCLDLLRRTLLALAPDDPPSPASLAGARRAWLLDLDFEPWPLDDPAVMSALAAWLRQGGRRLCLVGQDFGATARALPRFARWRRDWMHAIDVYRPIEGLVPAALRGLVAGSVGLQWLDAADWRLRVFTDMAHLQAMETQCADFLQRCEPSWPATTLGL